MFFCDLVGVRVRRCSYYHIIVVVYHWSTFELETQQHPGELLWYYYSTIIVATLPQSRRRFRPRLHRKKKNRILLHMYKPPSCWDPNAMLYIICLRVWCDVLCANEKLVVYKPPNCWDPNTVLCMSARVMCLPCCAVLLCVVVHKFRGISGGFRWCETESWSGWSPAPTCFDNTASTKGCTTRTGLSLRQWIPPSGKCWPICEKH